MMGEEIFIAVLALLFAVAFAAAVTMFVSWREAKDELEALQRSRLPFGCGADSVRNPRHYEGDGEVTCDRAMASMMYGADVTNSTAYWWGCAFKYVWRWPLKNGLEDLLKARECLDRIIEEVGR